MDELLIALVAGTVGAAIGLTGTAMTLISQRRLARDQWLRENAVDAVADMLTELNHFSRAFHRGGEEFDIAWLRFANSFDRADMFIEDKTSSEMLGRVFNSALEIHQGRAECEDPFQYIWPQMRDIKRAVRVSLP